MAFHWGGEVRRWGHLLCTCVRKCWLDTWPPRRSQLRCCTVDRAPFGGRHSLRAEVAGRRLCTLRTPVPACGSQAAAASAGDASFAANACCHPAFFGKEQDLAQKVTNPVCILPTKDDPMEDIKAVLDKDAAIGPKCFYRRYDDQEHGFLAARGDYKDPKVAEAAGKALEDLTGFFNANMK